MVNRGLIDIRPVEKEKQDPCWSRGRIKLSNVTGLTWMMWGKLPSPGDSIDTSILNTNYIL